MAGAWEIRQQKLVLCAFLHTELVTTAWSLNMMRVAREYPWMPIVPIAGRPFDHARDDAGWMCLNNEFEYLFFIDSDVLLPPGGLHRLLSHKKPVVSGVYHRRSTPHGIPVLMRFAPGTPHLQWVVHYPRDRLFPVDVAGAGCLLIHRSVLEKLPWVDERRGHRWFDWRVNMAAILPPGEALSEDYVFNMHCKKHLGIPVLVDPSVQSGHLGPAEAREGGFVPAECPAA